MTSLTFSGSTEDLKAIVRLLHVEGHWVHEGPFDLYRLESGETINFWPSTGVVHVNGHPGLAHDIRDRLNNLITSASQA
jgi:hypothetical protein